MNILKKFEGLVSLKYFYLTLLLSVCLVLAEGNPLRAEDIKKDAKEVPPVAEVVKPASTVIEEEKPTVDFTVSVLSAYVAKGDELSRNSVVVQPSMTVGYKGFIVNLWGNLDSRPYLSQTTTYSGDKRHNWTETDFTLSYSKTIGLLNAGLSYAYYGNAAYFPGDVDQKDDQEMFMSLGLNTLLSPTFTVYRTFDSTQRWYFLLGISHTFEFNKMVSLKLGASGSYLLSQDDNRLKVNEDGTTSTNGVANGKYSNFHDAVLSVSLPLKILSTVTVTPQVSYNFPMCDDANYDMRARSMQTDTAFADRQSAYLVGGVSVSFNF